MLAAERFNRLEKEIVKAYNLLSKYSKINSFHNPLLEYVTIKGNAILSLSRSFNQNYGGCLVVKSFTYLRDLQEAIRNIPNNFKTSCITLYLNTIQTNPEQFFFNNP